MKLATFTIERLKKMPRPITYLSDVRRCALKSDAHSITIDEDSECVKILKDKYRAFNLGQHYGRVAKQYAGNATVFLPYFWDDIKAALAPAYEFAGGWLHSINVTGSALFGIKPTHDLDLSIRIKDWSAFQKNRDQFKALLPTRIIDLPVEYFFHSMNYGIWAELDCERRILYAPSSFNIDSRIISPDIERVIKVNDEREIRAAEKIKSGDCGCKRVKK